MRLIQITDCHLLSDPHRRAYSEINPYASLRQCLSLSYSLSPDAVLFTGDLSGDDSQASYAHFISLVKSNCPDVPFKVIAGNHDLNPHFTSFLSESILTATTPWKLGNWHIHGIDSTSEGTRGYVEKQQMNDISHSVNASSQYFHLVALHHHPIATGSWMDSHALENAQEVCQWFASQPQLAAMIYGHIHSVREDVIEKRPVLSAPSSCWQWRMSPEFGVETLTAGVRVIDLSPDGKISTFIRRIE